MLDLLCCCKRGMEDLDYEESNGSHATKTQDTEILDLFMESFNEEKEEFIRFLSKEVSKLCVNLDETHKNLSATRKELKENLCDSPLLCNGKPSNEEILSDVIDIVMDGASFYSNGLRTSLEERVGHIREDYDLCARDIEDRVMTILSCKDDNTTEMLEHPHHYFLVHFSLKASLIERLDQEIERLHLSIKGRIAERCISASIKMEKKLLDNFINSRFTLLREYGKMHFSISMMLINKAVRQRHDLCDTHVTFLKESLLYFSEMDSNQLVSALYTSLARAQAHFENNKACMNHYLNKFKLGKTPIDICEVASHIYSYFLQVSSALHSSQEVLPLTNPTIAIASTEAFVAKHLAGIRKGVPPHIRLSNSEGNLLEISKHSDDTM